MDESAGLTNNEKTWGMLCHLSTFCVFIGVPFGNIIAPLVIWLIKKDESAFIAHNGKEALNFQITITIYWIVSMLLISVVIGIVLLPAVLVFDLVFTIIAAVKTNNGQWYRYPLTLRFVS